MRFPIRRNLIEAYETNNTTASSNADPSKMLNSGVPLNDAQTDLEGVAVGAPGATTSFNANLGCRYWVFLKPLTFDSLSD